MNIVICDDDKNFACSLESKLQTYMAQKNISYDIKRYTSGESLLSSAGQIDLLFLEAKLTDTDGIEIARILRQKYPEIIVVYVTSYIEYAMKGYEVKAFRYILKEQFTLLFNSTMNEILHEFSITCSKIKLKFAYGAETIVTDNLMYIESKLHALYFYFNGTKERRHLYDKLDEIQKILPTRKFIRIHKSYLLNIDYLHDVKNYLAILKNNICLPISQKRFKEIKNRCF